MIQAPSAVVMVRPHRFMSNPETIVDNAFQHAVAADAATARQAREEFDRAVAELTAEGVRVHAFDDFGEHDCPDSVFPNNWLSTHHGGRVAIYPMFTPNRRRERRADIVEMLKAEYRVQEVIDYSGLEPDGLFLEGTGAMVMDHIERIAYVARSNRANPIILERFCTTFGYEPMVFDSADADGRAIYHTNVMMSIATDFALICLKAIVDPGRRREIASRLEAGGRRIIEISHDQVAKFAGNAIELTGRHGRVLALSGCGVESLRPDQRAAIEAGTRLLPLDIPTIELAGGSVRCMIAGVHLTRRAG